MANSTHAQHVFDWIANAYNDRLSNFDQLAHGMGDIIQSTKG
jgi:hypothetical protein